jgi:hypothetical protein
MVSLPMPMLKRTYLQVIHPSRDRRILSSLLLGLFFFMAKTDMIEKDSIDHYVILKEHQVRKGNTNKSKTVLQLELQFLTLSDTFKHQQVKSQKTVNGRASVTKPSSSANF